LGASVDLRPGGGLAGALVARGVVGDFTAAASVTSSSSLYMAIWANALRCACSAACCTGEVKMKLELLRGFALKGHRAKLETATSTLPSGVNEKDCRRLWGA